MFEKIQNLLHHPYIEQFRDIRAVGFAVFGVVVIMVSWSGVNVIQRNFELQKEISTLQQEIQIAELENANLELENQYYDTDAYLELAARRQFGKGLPGETLILIPKDVALSHTIPPEETLEPAVIDSGSKPRYQQNLEAWREFFSRPSN